MVSEHLQSSDHTGDRRGSIIQGADSLLSKTYDDIPRGFHYFQPLQAIADRISLFSLLRLEGPAAGVSNLSVLNQRPAVISMSPSNTPPRLFPVEAFCALIHGGARLRHLNKAGPVGS